MEAVFYGFGPLLQVINVRAALNSVRDEPG